MTLEEFDRAMAQAESELVNTGDPTALEKLLSIAERNAARAVIRCSEHKRYQAKRQPVGTKKHPNGCVTCWKIWNATRMEGGR